MPKISSPDTEAATVGLRYKAQQRHRRIENRFQARSLLLPSLESTLKFMAQRLEQTSF